MKTMKNLLCVILVVAMLIPFAGCGCSNDEENALVPSDLTGADILNAFWDTDLEASAEKLNGYRAQSVEEVVNNWRQAKMQGNGAILYSLYSTDLKLIFLNRMKSEFGTWNFYYGRESERPMDILVSTPDVIEDTNTYYVRINTIYNDGTTTAYDIYVQLVDGGYFVTSEQAPEVE